MLAGAPASRSHPLAACFPPGDFQVLSLCWHSNGDSLALLSKDHFCLCFLEAGDGGSTALGRPGGLT